MTDKEIKERLQKAIDRSSNFCKSPNLNTINTSALEVLSRETLIVRGIVISGLFILPLDDYRELKAYAEAQGFIV